MKAIGHLITGAAVAVAADTTIKNLTYASEPISSAAATLYSADFYSAPIHSGNVGFALFWTLYVLGLLIPDCDTEESFISRIIYVPVEHRTWTHSIWPVLCLCLTGVFYRPALGLALGMAVHILCDAISVSGICWLYPITKYKDSFETKTVATTFYGYYVGAEWKEEMNIYHVNPHHHVKLYSSKYKGSIAIVSGVLCVLSFIYYMASMYALWR